MRFFVLVTAYLVGRNWRCCGGSLSRFGCEICGFSISKVNQCIFTHIKRNPCFIGLSDPFVQFLRFSAGEIATGPFKTKAVSYVIAGGAMAAGE